MERLLRKRAKASKKTPVKPLEKSSRKTSRQKRVRKRQKALMRQQALRKQTVR